MQKPIGNALQKAKILLPTPENLSLLASAIQRGEVIGMPTETVYGLAGDSRSPLALARIFETKERPTFDPLIVHVGSLCKRLSDLETLHLVNGVRLSDSTRNQIQKLMDRFWPGPLTLVLPKHADVPDLATSGLPTVALRMPRHPVAQALITASQCPLAAPSANRFGRISPTSPQAVFDELGDRIHWILDGGPSQIGVESTIIGLNESQEWTVFRPGGTPTEDIEATLGTRLLFKPSPAQHGAPTPAPGMLESHYAPSKPLRLLTKRVAELNENDLPTLQALIKNTPPQDPIGLLLMGGTPESLSSGFSQLVGRSIVARTLSPTEDLQEAARNLFSEMRWLDDSPVSLIFAEFCFPNQGLGYAISDRLRRASTR